MYLFMISVIKKFWECRWVLRSLPFSIYFNYHYLPLKQACLLPIWFYKPSFGQLKGRVILDCEKIKPGLVRLGLNRCSLFPNSGMVFENHGGTIVFKGSCSVGNASALSIGPKGYIEFGDYFSATTQFRCTAYNHIEFGARCRFGWDCLVMDTYFHKLKKMSGGYTKGYGSIKLGSDNWIGTRCLILKNTETSDFCIVASGTKLNGKYVFDNRVIIGSSNDVVLKKEGYWRDIFDDYITY